MQSSHLTCAHSGQMLSHAAVWTSRPSLQHFHHPSMLAGKVYDMMACSEVIFFSCGASVMLACLPTCNEARFEKSFGVGRVQERRIDGAVKFHVFREARYDHTVPYAEVGRSANTIFVTIDDFIYFPES